MNEHRLQPCSTAEEAARLCAWVVPAMDDAHRLVLLTKFTEIIQVAIDAACAQKDSRIAALEAQLHAEFREQNDYIVRLRERISDLESSLAIAQQPPPWAGSQ